MIDTELRSVLRDLADEGRPVNVGERALRGVRRRRRRTAVVAAAVVAALPLAWIGRGAGPDLPARPVGQHVLSAYAEAAADGSKVLDPERGTYREVDGYATAVSPDLRIAAGTVDERNGSATLRLWPTTGDGPGRTISLPAAASGLPVWSPSGTRLLVAQEETEGSPADDATADDAVADDATAVGSTAVALVGALDGSVREVTMHHPGRQAVGVWWLDDTTIAVGTAPPGEPTDDAEEIRTYRLDGTSILAMPAPTKAFCGDGLAYPPPPVLDGATLFCGRTGPDTFLYQMRPLHSPVAVRLSAVPGRSVVPVAWVAPDTAVVLAMTDAGPMSLHTVDLRTGKVGPAVGGFPGDATIPVVTGAEALSGAAQGLAF